MESQQYNLITKMNSSQSHALLRDRSRSFRCLYENEEVVGTKDISSIFHSPFKDGRRNRSFVSPTFASSTLFYPGEYPQPGASPQKNVVYNKNYAIKKELYEKRMSKQDLLVNKSHAAINSTMKKESPPINQINASDPPMVSKPKKGKQQQLMRELEGLINYHENSESRRRPSKPLQESNINVENESIPTPVYIQKNRKQMDVTSKIENRKHLQEWMQLSAEIKKMKESARRTNKMNETEAVSKSILRNQMINKSEQENSRRNASLLANILKEQIKQCKAKQRQERENRYNF